MPLLRLSVQNIKAQTQMDFELSLSIIKTDNLCDLHVLQFAINRNHNNYDINDWS